jgi:hypothetical protein
VRAADCFGLDRHASRGTRKHPRIARDDVHDAAKGIRSIEQRLRTLHHLDPLDRRDRNARQVEATADPADERLTIEENEDVLTAESL